MLPFRSDQWLIKGYHNGRKLFQFALKVAVKLSPPPSKEVQCLFRERVLNTDLKTRLDRATYCFRAQVFEAIGATLVGPNLLLMGGI